MLKNFKFKKYLPFFLVGFILIILAITSYLLNLIKPEKIKDVKTAIKNNEKTINCYKPGDEPKITSLNKVQENNESCLYVGCGGLY